MRIHLLLVALLAISGCDGPSQSSDEKQQQDQERILAEGTSQVGMPAIKNFRERKILKDIYEMRDQEGLTTYTYIVAENSGKLIFLGESVGYGLAASIQFTNPQKIAEARSQTGYAILPQADPNGLFSPASAEGTWVMLLNKQDHKVHPVYIEPRVIVSPFPLNPE